MRVLVTNDDGIYAPGITVLAPAIAELGHEVIAAAPLEDMSGCGAAMGKFHIDQHVDTVAAEIPGHPEITALGVAGTPALAVLAARLGAFGTPPDVVVSGVNPGLNTGRSVLHSGTVGAVLTGANLGVSGLAVSLEDDDSGLCWETAAELAQRAFEWLVAQPERTVLNLNVPNRPLGELAGVRWARLAPFGTVRAAVTESRHGRIQMELTATGDELPADTDTALVAAGFAAVTAINGIRATERVDVAEQIEGRVQRRSA